MISCPLIDLIPSKVFQISHDVMILLLKMGITGEILGEVCLLELATLFSPILNQGKNRGSKEKCDSRRCWNNWQKSREF